MADSVTKLDQALMDLVEAYAQLEDDLEDKFGDDEDSFESSMIEALESTIDATVDEQGVRTSVLAALFNQLSEALEQYDPSAFIDEDDDDDIDYSLSNDSDDIDDDDDGAEVDE